MRLNKKVALVTGGASGIGEAICRRFAREGAQVIISDINSALGEALATELNQAGQSAFFVQQDVTDEARWQQVMGEIAERFQALEILVNNAGIAVPGSVEDCTYADWQRTQKINNDAVFLGTQAAISVMKENGGSIINISSIEGIVGEPNAAAYNASKGAVRIFTKSAALHCAKQGYNIRVNSLHPGYVETPLISGAAAAMDPAVAAEWQQRVLSEVPLGRLGKPEEIASAALFLASDEASYMTGSELVVDGGYTSH